MFGWFNSNSKTENTSTPQQGNAAADTGSNASNINVTNDDDGETTIYSTQTDHGAVKSSLATANNAIIANDRANQYVAGISAEALKSMEQTHARAIESGQTTLSMALDNNERVAQSAIESSERANTATVSGFANALDQIRQQSETAQQSYQSSFQAVADLAASDDAQISEETQKTVRWIFGTIAASIIGYAATRVLFK